jgi:hypothetical protein
MKLYIPALIIIFFILGYYSYAQAAMPMRSYSPARIPTVKMVNVKPATKMSASVPKTKFNTPVKTATPKVSTRNWTFNPFSYNFFIWFWIFNNEDKK